VFEKIVRRRTRGHHENSLWQKVSLKLLKRKIRGWKKSCAFLGRENLVV
jgi:hypothetical protein